MTAQSAEQLHNEHPDLVLGAWSVYGLMRGEPSPENHGWGARVRVYATDPGDPKHVTTANWKGFTEVYRLTRAGHLVLERFDYDDRAIPTRIVGETLAGDFYLVLKCHPMGLRLYVPFRDGSLVLDGSAWLHEVYTGPSPVQTELRQGCNLDFPGPSLLWHEIDFAPDTTPDPA
jgi:hypothetical protein